jgi:hypothetical protein
MRNFVSITVETDATRGRVRYIGTSTERFLYDTSGEVSTRQAVDFLFSLNALSRRKENKNASFVWYAAQLDVEVLLRDLPPEAKDVLFSSPEHNREKSNLRRAIDRNTRTIASYVSKREAINEGRKSALRSLPLPCKDKRAGVRLVEKLVAELDAENRLLRERLHALEFVYWGGYRLRVRQGKSLTIYKLSASGKARKGLTIFDLCHFFNKRPLPDVSKEYLGYSPPALDRTPGLDLPLWDNAQTKVQAFRDMVAYVEAETATIKHLAERLDAYLNGIGLELSRWYGASSAVNTLLGRWKARREFKRMTEDNTPRALHHAVESAFYGGRIETLKLGTLPSVEERDADPLACVYVYDLNSAFAWATTLLPKLTRWRFTRNYNLHEPFALWYVEYELPPDCYIGMLPHRTNGGTVYRLAGKGWYYAPEVREIVRRYGQYANVKYGYIVPYTPVGFAENIRELYQQRLDLIAREGKGKGERIIKSMLQCFYGKFSQNTGVAPYRCLPYASWITSFVRSLMLEACAGQEQDVICFHTDAVHARKPLVGARVGNALGEWSLTTVPGGRYLQSGLYCHLDESGRVIKSATRGFEYVNFERAVDELNKTGGFYAEREYFTGWRLAQEFPLMRGNDYLQRVSERQYIEPLKMKPRVFRNTVVDGREVRHQTPQFDWRTSWVDSRIVTHNDRRESGKRRVEDSARRASMMLDVLSAKRY